MIEKINANLPSRHTVAVGLATLAAVAVALSAFARSFSALSHLAVMHGWPTGQAWILPVALDGMIVVPTVAAVVMHRGRWYSWCLLVAGTALSVAGNGIHAWITTESNVAVGLAVIPPIVTLAAVHLAIVVARQGNQPATADHGPRRGRRRPQEPKSETISVVAAPAPLPASVTPLHSVTTATASRPAATHPVATRPAAPRRDTPVAQTRPEPRRDTPATETRPAAPRRDTHVAPRPAPAVAPTVAQNVATLPEADDALRRRALQLVSEGRTRRDVAAELGITKDKVQRWVTAAREKSERETVAV